MSHQPERKERNCLNCGTIVAGRFCQNCGQENILPHQNFWGLTRHFIFDIFHFDGKFFETLRFLLFRPGFVPAEYVSGKRSRYLDPIRMYLFTSALFFLFFISLKSFDKEDKDDELREMNKFERMDYTSGVYRRYQGGDSSLKGQLNILLDTSRKILLKKPTGVASADTGYRIRLDDKEYLMTSGRSSTDSLNSKRPKNFVNLSLSKKYQENIWKYGGNEKAFIYDLLNSFLHRVPYILFISLPFFALILKLLYFRRKNYYYSDHFIFTLYHYIFTFILLLICLLLGDLNDWLDWEFLTFLITLLFLSGGVYLFLSMKRFYGQDGGKTFGKFLLLNILAFIIIIILMLIFILLSVFQFNV